MSGLIGSMLGGAFMEGGKAGEEVGGEFLKASFAEVLKRKEAEIQQDRDARLSEERKAEYAARTPVDVDKARQMLPVEAEKSRAEADQKIRVATESLPKEHAGYYTAAADRMNAEADAIRNGEKYRAKAGEKPILPSIKVEKDAEGNPYMIDQNSGAIGVIRPGEPAKAGETHWFSPDEPATKAGAPTVEWNLNGKPTKLESLYPSIAGRIGGDAGAMVDPYKGSGGAPSPAAFDPRAKGPTPSPAAIARLRQNPELAESFKQHYGIDPQAYLGKSGTQQQPGGFKLTAVDIEAAMTDPRAYDKLAGTVGGKATLDAIISDYSRTEQKKTARLPATGLIGSGQTAAPEDLGQQVDQLKIPYEEAKSRLRAFGQIQIRANPSGYAKAKDELERAREPYELAVDAYQRALGAAGKPVTGRTRY